MRTLKKALSLVLVLAMVFALAVPGFAADTTKSASSYKDYSKVTNKEAVDVLTAIGVLHGNTDGTFGPEGNFTRAEAAVLLTYMLLGDKIADALPNTTCKFADVPAWAAKYVQYCADEKIIAGYGDGKFGANDPLTAAQWALMLLKAVKAEGSDKVGGDGWALQATKLAMQTKLATADDMTGTFNRDVAAKLALNGLFYTEKQATQTTVTKYVVLAVAGGHNIPTAAVGKQYDSYADAVTGATTANASATLGTDYTISAITATQTTYTDSLADNVFALKKSTSVSADGFGRPATGYEQTTNGVTKTIATCAATPVATYTGTVSADELYNKLGYNATIVAASSSNVALTKVAGYLKNTSGTIAADATNNITVSNKNTAIGGAGIITEIYKTATANQYTVVQIQPTLAKVGTPVKHTATATEGAYTEYTIAGQTVKEYTSVVNATNDKNNFTSDVALTKDAYVLIYGTSTTGYTIKAATLVEGAVTGYTSKTNAWTIGGTSYPESAAAKASGLTVTAPAINSTKATYAVDTYGNVIGSVSIAAPTNYVFVLQAAVSSYLNTTTNKIESVAEATVITVDGELKTIKTDAAFDSTGVTDLDKTTAGTQTSMGLYSYTINSTNNLYQLKTESGAAVSQIKKGDVSLGGSLYANNATKYYVAQYDSTNSKYTGVVSYTGFANVPNLTLPANVKAVDANNDGIAEVVFVDYTTATASATKFVYFTGDYNVDAKGAKEYKVIVAGKEDTMKVTNTSVVTAGLYSVNNAGLATAVTAGTTLNIAGGNDGTYANQFYTYNNGVLMTGATATAVTSVLAAIGADVPVYTFEKGACTTSTAADLSATTGTLVVFAVNAAHNAIDAVYIVK